MTGLAILQFACSAIVVLSNLVIVVLQARIVRANRARILSMEAHLLRALQHDDRKAGQ